MLKITPSAEDSYVQLKDKDPSPIPTTPLEVNNPTIDFVKCLLGEKHPETSLDVIEKVALLSDKIYESFEKGKIATID